MINPPEPSTLRTLPVPVEIPRPTFGWRWRLGLLVIALGLFFAWFVFPQGDRSLWPPAQRDDRYRVFVTVDEYHTCINFPDYQLGLFQEWHMGARDWYLGNDPSFLQVVAQSLKGKEGAVLRFGLFTLPYWQRMQVPQEKVFSFWLTPEGHKRLVNALHEFRGHDMIRSGQYWYFTYTRGYQLLSNCNSFTARALIAAGLPFRESLALEGLTMTWQLRRCMRLQQELGGSGEDVRKR